MGLLGSTPAIVALVVAVAGRRHSKRPGISIRPKPHDQGEALLLIQRFGGQNIQQAIPDIPGGEAHLAEIRRRVDALRTTQDTVQMLRGQLTDAVILRRQQNKEASKGFRNLAAVARAHFGWANPVLESFNIRSEHRAKRGRKKKEVKPAVEA